MTWAGPTGARRRSTSLLLAWVSTVLAVTVGCTTETDEPSASRVEAALERRLASDPVYDDVRAVLVDVDGRVIVEKYYATTADQRWPVQSVTKSVLGTLVGIAVDQGLLRLRAPLAELLPAYRDRMRPIQARITLEQVLTMTAGFPPESPSEIRALEEEDPVAHALDLWSGPVDRHVYSNLGSHVLSAILVEATGMSVLDFARAELFEPLDIDTRPAFESPVDLNRLEDYLAADFAWPVDRQGRHLGGTGLKVLPSDLLKLGQLYLADGAWVGERVVSAGWTRSATSAQVEVSDSGGLLDDYGFQWWVGELEGEPAASAWGFGGEVVTVVPSMSLVAVVVTEVDILQPPGPTTRGLTEGLVEVLLESAVASYLDR